MRRFFVLLMAFALVMGLPLTSALADTTTINFEPGQGYVPGTIDGQQGWAGSGGQPVNPAIDQSVVLNAAYPSATTTGFGDQSFRMSNAYADGAFGWHVYSPSLTDEAGETDAASDGWADGTRQTRFEATWDFTSATGAPQSGLAVVVSPDRGDGARMSWVQMYDDGGAGGLQVRFTDATFVITTIATGLSRTSPHTIKLQMDFIDGESNDIVRVWVDGNLVHTGTSWEQYYREQELNPTRPVDSVLIRPSLPSTGISTQNNGFLLDNLTLFSGPRDLAADLSLTKSDSPDPVHIGQKLTYTLGVTNNGPDSATGVSLVDNLPKNAGFGSATTTQGSCTVKPAKQLVTCNLGTLTSGQTVTVTIVVKPSKKGTITNTATATATSPTDPNTANNTATQNTTVLP
jgi:uncharacterized repeat protein (TIGR01451 family)